MSSSGCLGPVRPASPFAHDISAPWSASSWRSVDANHALAPGLANPTTMPAWWSRSPCRPRCSRTRSRVPLPARAPPRRSRRSRGRRIDDPSRRRGSRRAYRPPATSFSAPPSSAKADVETFLDQPHVGAHDPGQQDIADTVVHRVLVGHPVLLHEDALHPDVRRDGRDLASLVRLDSADRHERVGLEACFGDQVFELAELLPPNASPLLQSSRLA